MRDHLGRCTHRLRKGRGYMGLHKGRGLHPLSRRLEDLGIIRKP